MVLGITRIKIARVQSGSSKWEESVLKGEVKGLLVARRRVILTVLEATDLDQCEIALELV